MNTQKKAQSEIISTVLLILIAITAIVVVSSFVIPFIKKQLSGTSCLDVSGKIEIKNNPAYTCYKDGELRVQVHMGDTGNKTKGFQLSIEAGGSTNSFKIIPEASLENIRMYGEEIPEAALPWPALKLPGAEEEKTYIISGLTAKPDSINVYPILEDDQVCGASDTLTTIPPCSA